MEKLKEFFQDHKKIIIIVAVLVIIAIAGICIYLATRAKDTGSATSDDKQNEIQEAENQEDTSDETTDPSTSSAANGNLVSNGPTYWFENGFTQEDLKAIMKEGIRNADANGLYNGVYYGNYVNVQKTVKTGSYQEDQGHYETQTYVDYQYCSVCGARK